MGTIKEDEADDIGLETQVVKIVEENLVEFENSQKARLTEISEKMEKSLEQCYEKLEEIMKVKISAIEKEMNMIAVTHIQDFSQIKGVTRDFVMSKERFDQKLQLVIDLEREHQLVLQHMRKTSNIV